VYYDDAPFRGELVNELTAEAFAGQDAPVTVSILPLKDLGRSTVTVSALSGPRAAIPAAAIDAGYVSYRLSRVTADGAVYTITPRLILPRNTVNMPQSVARTFWLTVRAPAIASPRRLHRPGDFHAAEGRAAADSAAVHRPPRERWTPRTYRWVHFGGGIGIPWFADDPHTLSSGSEMTAKSLRSLRAHGFTMFSGVPHVAYRGFHEWRTSARFRCRGSRDARRQG